MDLLLYDCPAVRACVLLPSFVLDLPTALLAVGERDEPEEHGGEHDVQDDVSVLAQALGQTPRRVLIGPPRRRVAAAPEQAGVLFFSQRVLLAVVGGTGHLDVEDSLVELDLDRRGVTGAGEVEPLEEVAPLEAAVEGALAADLEAPRRLHLDLELVPGESCNNGMPHACHILERVWNDWIQFLQK